MIKKILYKIVFLLSIVVNILGFATTETDFYVQQNTVISINESTTTTLHKTEAKEAEVKIFVKKNTLFINKNYITKADLYFEDTQTSQLEIPKKAAIQEKVSTNSQKPTTKNQQAKTQFSANPQQTKSTICETNYIVLASNSPTNNKKSKTATDLSAARNIYTGNKKFSTQKIISKQSNTLQTLSVYALFGNPPPTI